MRFQKAAFAAAVATSVFGCGGSVGESVRDLTVEPYCSPRPVRADADESLYTGRREFAAAHLELVAAAARGLQSEPEDNHWHFWSMRADRAVQYEFDLDSKDREGATEIYGTVQPHGSAAFPGLSGQAVEVHGRIWETETELSIGITTTHWNDHFVENAQWHAGCDPAAEVSFAFESPFTATSTSGLTSGGGGPSSSSPSQFGGGVLSLPGRAPGLASSLGTSIFGIVPRCWDRLGRDVSCVGVNLFPGVERAAE